MSCSLARRRPIVVLEQLDRQQLALVVPLVHRRVDVEPFVALQADQPRVADRGQSLGDLGLADAGVAFEQQGPAEIEHEQQRRGERAARRCSPRRCQVALQGDDLVHAFAGQSHAVFLPNRPRSQSLSTPHASARPFSSLATCGAAWRRQRRCRGRRRTCAWVAAWLTADAAGATGRRRRGSAAARCAWRAPTWAAKLAANCLRIWSATRAHHAAAEGRGLAAHRHLAGADQRRKAVRRRFHARRQVHRGAPSCRCCRCPCRAGARCASPGRRPSSRLRRGTTSSPARPCTVTVPL